MSASSLASVWAPWVFPCLFAASACNGASVVEQAGGSGGGGGGAATSSTSGTTSASTGGGVEPECVVDADCELVDDCCSCVGVPAGQMGPMCDMPECFALACEASGFLPAGALCRVGRCVAGFVCDPLLVSCNSPPPACELGTTAQVVDGCWQGCVPASQCISVASCDVCNQFSDVCVTEVQRLGPVNHCVNVPLACDGDETCACMGSSVCVVPSDVCDDGVDGLRCSCPTC